MLFLLFLSAAAGLVFTALLIRYARQHAERYSDFMPQRFHVGHVPRLGGAAMFLACTVGWAAMAIATELRFPYKLQMEASTAIALLVATLIPVAGGVIEDLTQRLAARLRLVLTVGAALIAVFTLELTMARLGIRGLDMWLVEHPWVGVVIAVLAVGGLPHAFNLIDGYNGLAGAVAIICCLALAYVALQVGDRQIAGIVLTLAGATAGFLVWNYPRGLIFAGDGGAYLWGTVIAICCVLLVARHPNVSPWFPVLLLLYPVQETFFSIYRKLARGQSPAMADALHLHQLIYRRIVREVFHDDEARRMLMRNNRTSPYLWGFSVLTVVPAALFWSRTGVLMFFVALFVVLYVWAYWSIVRFKLQRWVRRPQGR
jgi:UDP-GlcNAc:undecaprenyl-phosphate GlcNAc-1-phosphate transferase